MICRCYFCTEGQPHPDARHPNFHDISSRLLKAESLDPNDSIAMEACTTCGHKRDKETN